MSRPVLILAILSLVLGVAAIVFLTSTDSANPDELIVGSVEEIESKGVVYVQDPGLYVVAGNDGLIALGDDARHVGDRVLYCSLDETFSSPAHGERFDRQGRYLAGPASGDMGTYPVELRNNQIVVDVSNGPHLPGRSVGGFADAELSQCGGSEDPPGFYSGGVP